MSAEITVWSSGNHWPHTGTNALNVNCNKTHSLNILVALPEFELGLS